MDANRMEVRPVGRDGRELDIFLKEELSGGGEMAASGPRFWGH